MAKVETAFVGICRCCGRTVAAILDSDEPGRAARVSKEVGQWMFHDNLIVRRRLVKDAQIDVCAHQKVVKYEPRPPKPVKRGKGK